VFLRRALAAFETQRRGPAVQLLQRKGGWNVEVAFGARELVSASNGGSSISGVVKTQAFGARDLARLVLRYDLRRSIAPASAPFFCVAADSLRLENAAAISIAASAAAVATRPPSPLLRPSSPTAPQDCAGMSLRGPQEEFSSMLLSQVPTTILLLILARFLPTAAPGGIAAHLARTCSLLADIVRSGDFWAEALKMRYRVMPSIDALAACLGPSPSQHEVSMPSGLASFSPGGEPGYVLSSPPPLSEQQLRNLGLDGTGVGVGPGESLVKPVGGLATSVRTGEEEEEEKAKAFPPMPAVFLAMTERGPTVVLLEPVDAGTPVLEFAGEVSPLITQPGGRSFFGGRHEVWIDVLDTRTQPGGSSDLDQAPRRRLCVSAQHRGNEARWVRFCRMGEVPTLRLEVAFDNVNPDSKSSAGASGSLYKATPRLVLVADHDLPAFTELTWIDLHFCSSPEVRAAALSENSEVREQRTVPALQELQQLADLLRFQKRAGAFPGAEGAHAFIAL